MRIDNVSAAQAGQPQAMTGASSYSAASSLYKQADSNQSGSINLAQLVQALESPNRSGPKAEDGSLKTPPVSAGQIFSQLATQGDGTVTRQAFVSGVSKMVREWGNGNSGIASSPEQTLAANLNSLLQSSSASPNSLDAWA
ncbi:MAG: hypothetical protein U0892_12200 [Pirellulales bacterium]